MLVLRMPDGRVRAYALHGCESYVLDACYVATDARERRFVRMLELERDRDRAVIITPPELGAVAPHVVSIPEAPADATIVDGSAWDVLADWVTSGGRLAACTIADLARLVTIASPHFAMLIGEVAAQRAIELAWAARGPLRGGFDLDSALQPLTDAARHSARAAEALVSALAHAAGVKRRRRRR